MSDRATIAKVFQLAEDDGSNSLALTELESLCRIYSLSAQDLHIKWEAFSFSLRKGPLLTPTVDLIRQFRINLQRDFEQSLQQQQKQQRTTTRTVVTNTNTMMDFSEYSSAMDEDDILENFMSKLTGQGVAAFSKPTPAAGAATSTMNRSTTSFALSSQLQPSQTSTQFSERKAAHVVDDQYNGHLATRGSLSSTEKRAIVKPIQTVDAYRYMFEKIRDRADALDERIEFIMEAIEKHHNLTEPYGNPTRPNQSSIVAAGRICCDATEGKLNDKSVVLETSRELGMGKRVRLNLDNVEEFGLFPGQIVGVEGVNNTGDIFTVNKFLMPPLPPAPVRSPRQLYESSYGTTMNGLPLEMVVAAGPYTLDDDLSYRPLEELLVACASLRPDVIILLGPFVSESHPSVASGTMEVSPEETFEQNVTSRLIQLSKQCPETRILVMPHPDDMILEYPLFPQPSFDKKLIVEDLNNSVQFLSNPATVDINGTILAIGNIDILMHMGAEEISRSKTHSDRLARLTKHLLEQQTFYPLFPPAPGDSIDSEKLPDIQIPVKPDILVIPSKLKHFVKIVEHVVCLNPGHLTRKLSGGTYAKITIHPLPKLADGSVGTDAKLHERTRIDLVKL